jgi:methyl-accepting chemotaxis protein
MKNSVWAPLRSKFLSISIGWTLSLILLLGLIPALVMGSYFVSSGRQDIAIVESELQGVALLRDLQPVGKFFSGTATDPEAHKLAAAQALKQLTKALNRDGVRFSMNLEVTGKALEKQLGMIAQGMDVNAELAYEKLITRIGDQSGLILDPQLDSYYLMDIILIKSARLTKAADKLESAYPEISGPYDPLFLILRHELASSTRELSDSMQLALSGNADGSLGQGKVPETTNAVVAAANAVISSQTAYSDHSTLHRAIETNWKTTSNALVMLLKQREAKIKSELTKGLVVCGAAILIVILLAGTLIMALIDGMRLISYRLSDLSDGDYVTPVPGTDFNNDIGVIANALQSFIDLSGQIEGERAQAQAELEAAISQVRQENEALMADTLHQQTQASEIERQMVARLAAELESKVSGLLADSGVAADQMKLEAAAMNGSSNGVQKEAGEAAKAADEILHTVESIAPAVESVSRQLSEYTHSLSDAKILANDAVKRVEDANSRIGEFNTATVRAASMLELITNVAHKTNMLALNASIEAVRVGEAGQGFMVVAEEVKSLAKSTRDAAHEISAQIAAMDSANLAVTGAFEQVLKVVNTLAGRSVSVANGMGQQSAAIAEVEVAVSTAMTELGRMMQRIHSADSSAGSAIIRSNEVLAASENVSANFDKLDDTVRNFLGNLQSAQQKAA